MCLTIWYQTWIISWLESSSTTIISQEDKAAEYEHIEFARAAQQPPLNDIVVIWSRKARLVLSSTRCKEITIRMDDAQCPQKCCRLDENALWTLLMSRRFPE